MSAHLTNEELTDNLLGVSSLTVSAHLISCPACTNELDQLKYSIAEFCGAAHAWSASALVADRTMSVARTLPKRSWAPNRVLAAAAMILFAAGVAFYVCDYQVRNQTNSAQVAAVPVTTIDSPESQIEQELLSQVNSELAEAVPAPMQPLRLLESAASSTSTTK